MGDSELQAIIDKQRKLRALNGARDRVRQLERELYGEPAKPAVPSTLPQFLCQRQLLQAG